MPPEHTASTLAIPELVAHRGYPLKYPENSLIGIEAAIRAGARYVEVDVQLTRDQVPVLFHDLTLARVCNAPGRIYDLDSTALGRLRAGEYARFGYRYAQVRVAALEELAELLARHAHVTAFVELKTESVARFGPTVVAARVQRALAPVFDRCVLISYDLEALRAVRASGPIGAVIDRWRDRHRPALEALRPEYLFCALEGLPWFGRLRYTGARLAVFELGTDARRALRLARRGVSLVETFAVAELAAELESIAGAYRHAGTGL